MAFTIPKKSKHSDLLTEKMVFSRHFQHDLLPAIQNSYFYPLGQSSQRFFYYKLQTVHNEWLQRKFQEKRHEMRRGGYSDKDLKENYAFLCVDNEQQAEQICQDGLTVGNLPSSSLGQPHLGVQLCRHADVLRPTPLMEGVTYSLIVFKILKGHVKTVLENQAPLHLEPTPGYDCHVLPSAQNVGIPLRRLYQSTQVYLYDYGHEKLLNNPRHICPVAVVQFCYGERSSVEKPRPQTPASRELLSPANESTEYVIWSGRLSVKGLLACNVQMFSPELVTKPVNLGTSINISLKVGLKVGREKFLRGVFALTRGKEIYSGGWYITVFQLKAVQSKSNFERIRHYLTDKECMAVLKQDQGILLMMTDNEVSFQLGLTMHSYESNVHCIFLSKSSRKQKGSTHQSSQIQGHEGNGIGHAYTLEQNGGAKQRDLGIPTSIPYSKTGLPKDGGHLQFPRSPSPVLSVKPQIMATEYGDSSRIPQQASTVLEYESQLPSGDAFNDMEMIESSRSPFPKSYSETEAGPGKSPENSLGDESHFHPSSEYSNKLAEALTLSSQDIEPPDDDDLPPLIPWLPVNISETASTPKSSFTNSKPSSVHTSLFHNTNSDQNNNLETIRHSFNHPLNSQRTQTPPPFLQKESSINNENFDNNENLLSRPKALETLYSQNSSFVTSNFPLPCNSNLATSDSIFIKQEPYDSDVIDSVVSSENSADICWQRSFMDAFMEPKVTRNTSSMSSSKNMDASDSPMFTPEHNPSHEDPFVSPRIPDLDSLAKAVIAPETESTSAVKKPLYAPIVEQEETIVPLLGMDGSVESQMDIYSTLSVKKEPEDVEINLTSKFPGFQDNPTPHLYRSSSVPDIFGNVKVKKDFQIVRPDFSLLLDSCFWPKPPITSLLTLSKVRGSFIEQSSKMKITKKKKSLSKSSSLLNLHEMVGIYGTRKLEVPKSLVTKSARSASTSKNEKSKFEEKQNSKKDKNNTFSSIRCDHNENLEPKNANSCIKDNQTGKDNEFAGILEETNRRTPKVVLKRLNLSDEITYKVETFDSDSAIKRTFENVVISGKDTKLKVTLSKRKPEVVVERNLTSGAQTSPVETDSDTQNEMATMLNKSLNRKEEKEKAEKQKMVDDVLKNLNSPLQRQKEAKEMANLLNVSVERCINRKEETALKISGSLESLVENLQDESTEGTGDVGVGGTSVKSNDENKSVGNSKHHEHHSGQSRHHKKHKHHKHKKSKSKHIHTSGGNIDDFNKQSVDREKDKTSDDGHLNESKLKDITDKEHKQITEKQKDTENDNFKGKDIQDRCTLKSGDKQADRNSNDLHSERYKMKDEAPKEKQEKKKKAKHDNTAEIKYGSLFSKALDDIVSKKVQEIVSGSKKRKAEDKKSKEETKDRKHRTEDTCLESPKRKHSKTEPEKVQKRYKAKSRTSTHSSKQQDADKVLSALNMGVSRVAVSSLGRIPKKPQGQISKKSKKDDMEDDGRIKKRKTEDKEKVGTSDPNVKSKSLVDNLKEDERSDSMSGRGSIPADDELIPESDLDDFVLRQTPTYKISDEPKLTPSESGNSLFTSVMQTKPATGTIPGLGGLEDVNVSPTMSCTWRDCSRRQVLKSGSGLKCVLSGYDPVRGGHTADMDISECLNAAMHGVRNGHQPQSKNDQFTENVCKGLHGNAAWIEKKSVSKSVNSEGATTVLIKIDVKCSFIQSDHHSNRTENKEVTECNEESSNKTADDLRTYLKAVDSLVKPDLVLVIPGKTEVELDETPESDSLEEMANVINTHDEIMETEVGESSVALNMSFGTSLKQNLHDVHEMKADKSDGYDKLHETYAAADSKAGPAKVSLVEKSNPMVIEVTVKDKQKAKKKDEAVNVSVEVHEQKEEPISLTVELDDLLKLQDEKKGKSETASASEHKIRHSSGKSAAANTEKDSNKESDRSRSRSKSNEWVVLSSEGQSDTICESVEKGKSSAPGRRSRSKSNSKEEEEQSQPSGTRSRTNSESRSLRRSGDKSTPKKTHSSSEKSSRAGSEVRDDKSTVQRSRHSSEGKLSRSASKDESSNKEKKSIADRLESLATKSVTASEASKMDSRQVRQFHPYKKEEKKAKKSRKPKWSFDMAYRDMNELLQNLTTSFFRQANKRAAIIPRSTNTKSYDRKPRRFAGYKFQRSEVPSSPPRTRSPSPFDPENSVLGPELIPDLEEREKKADLLEDMFTQTKETNEEDEYTREQDIYSQEEDEDGCGGCTGGTIKDKSSNEKSNDWPLKSLTAALVIPGGPKTSLYSGAELDDDDDDESRELLGGLSSRPHQSEITVELPEMMETEKAGGRNHTKEKFTEETKLICNNEKLEDGNKTGEGICPVAASSDKSHLDSLLPENKQLTVSNEGVSTGSKVNGVSVMGNEDETKDRKSANTVSTDACKTVVKKSQERTALLSADSDSCLDWTDDEIALDRVDENTTFASTDDLSDACEEKKYLVVDSVGASDSESYEDSGQKNEIVKLVAEEQSEGQENAMKGIKPCIDKDEHKKSTSSRNICHETDTNNEENNLTLLHAANTDRQITVPLYDLKETEICTPTLPQSCLREDKHDIVDEGTEVQEPNAQDESNELLLTGTFKTDRKTSGMLELMPLADKENANISGTKFPVKESDLLAISRSLNMSLSPLLMIDNHVVETESQISDSEYAIDEHAMESFKTEMNTNGMLEMLPLVDREIEIISGAKSPVKESDTFDISRSSNMSRSPVLVIDEGEVKTESPTFASTDGIDDHIVEVFKTEGNSFRISEMLPVADKEIENISGDESPVKESGMLDVLRSLDMSRSPVLVIDEHVSDIEMLPLVDKEIEIISGAKSPLKESNTLDISRSLDMSRSPVLVIDEHASKTETPTSASGDEQQVEALKTEINTSRTPEILPSVKEYEIINGAKSSVKESDTADISRSLNKSRSSVFIIDEQTKSQASASDCVTVSKSKSHALIIDENEDKISILSDNIQKNSSEERSNELECAKELSDNIKEPCSILFQEKESQYLHMDTVTETNTESSNMKKGLMLEESLSLQAAPVVYLDDTFSNSDEDVAQCAATYMSVESEERASMIFLDDMVTNAEDTDIKVNADNEDIVAAEHQSIEKSEGSVLVPEYEHLNYNTLYVPQAAIEVEVQASQETNKTSCTALVNTAEAEPQINSSVNEVDYLDTEGNALPIVGDQCFVVVDEGIDTEEIILAVYEEDGSSDMKEVVGIVKSGLDSPIPEENPNNDDTDKLLDLAKRAQFDPELKSKCSVVSSMPDQNPPAEEPLEGGSRQKEVTLTTDNQSVATCNAAASELIHDHAFISNIAPPPYIGYTASENDKASVLGKNLQSYCLTPSVSCGSPSVFSYPSSSSVQPNTELQSEMSIKIPQNECSATQYAIKADSICLLERKNQHFSPVASAKSSDSFLCHPPPVPSHSTLQRSTKFNQIRSKVFDSDVSAGNLKQLSRDIKLGLKSPKLEFTDIKTNNYQESIDNTGESLAADRDFYEPQQAIDQGDIQVADTSANLLKAAENAHVRTVAAVAPMCTASNTLSEDGINLDQNCEMISPPSRRSAQCDTRVNFAGDTRCHSIPTYNQSLVSPLMTPVSLQRQDFLSYSGQRFLTNPFDNSAFSHPGSSFMDVQGLFPSVVRQNLSSVFRHSSQTAYWQNINTPIIPGSLNLHGFIPQNTPGYYSSIWPSYHTQYTSRNVQLFPHTAAVQQSQQHLEAAGQLPSLLFPVCSSPSNLCQSIPNSYLPFIQPKINPYSTFDLPSLDKFNNHNLKYTVNLHLSKNDSFANSPGLTAETVEKSSLTSVTEESVDKENAYEMHKPIGEVITSGRKTNIVKNCSSEIGFDTDQGQAVPKASEGMDLPQNFTSVEKVLPVETGCSSVATEDKKSSSRVIDAQGAERYYLKSSVKRTDSSKKSSIPEKDFRLEKPNSEESCTVLPTEYSSVLYENQLNVDSSVHFAGTITNKTERYILGDKDVKMQEFSKELQPFPSNSDIEDCMVPIATTRKQFDTEQQKTCHTHLSVREKNPSNIEETTDSSKPAEGNMHKNIFSPSLVDKLCRKEFEICRADPACGVFEKPVFIKTLCNTDVKEKSRIETEVALQQSETHEKAHCLIDAEKDKAPIPCLEENKLERAALGTSCTNDIGILTSSEEQKSIEASTIREMRKSETSDKEIEEFYKSLNPIILEAEISECYKALENKRQQLEDAAKSNAVESIELMLNLEKGNYFGEPQPNKIKHDIEQKNEIDLSFRKGKVKNIPAIEMEPEQEGCNNSIPNGSLKSLYSEIQHSADTVSLEAEISECYKALDIKRRELEDAAKSNAVELIELKINLETISNNLAEPQDENLNNNLKQKNNLDKNFVKENVQIISVNEMDPGQELHSNSVSTDSMKGLPCNFQLSTPISKLLCPDLHYGNKMNKVNSVREGLSKSNDTKLNHVPSRQDTNPSNQQEHFTTVYPQIGFKNSKDNEGAKHKNANEIINETQKSSEAIARSNTEISIHEDLSTDCYIWNGKVVPLSKALTPDENYQNVDSNNIPKANCTGNVAKPNFGGTNASTDHSSGNRADMKSTSEKCEDKIKKRENTKTNKMLVAKNLRDSLASSGKAPTPEVLTSSTKCTKNTHPSGSKITKIPKSRQKKTKKVQKNIDKEIDNFYQELNSMQKSPTVKSNVKTKLPVNAAGKCLVDYDDEDENWSCNSVVEIAADIKEKMESVQRIVAYEDDDDVDNMTCVKEQTESPGNSEIAKEQPALSGQCATDKRNLSSTVAVVKETQNYMDKNHNEFHQLAVEQAPAIMEDPKQECSESVSKNPDSLKPLVDNEIHKIKPEHTPEDIYNDTFEVRGGNMCQKTSDRKFTDEEIESWDTCSTTDTITEQLSSTSKSTKLGQLSISLLSSAYYDSSDEDIVTETQGSESKDAKDSLSALKGYTNDDSDLSDSSSDLGVSDSSSDESDTTDDQKGSAKTITDTSSHAEQISNSNNKIETKEEKADDKKVNFIKCKWVEEGILSPDNSDTESVCNTSCGTPDTIKVLSDSDELYEPDAVVHSKLSSKMFLERASDSSTKDKKPSLLRTKRSGFVSAEIARSPTRSTLSEFSDTSEIPNILNSSYADSSISNISNLSLTKLEERQKHLLEKILLEDKSDLSVKAGSETEADTESIHSKVCTAVSNKIADIRSWVKHGQQTKQLSRKKLSEKLEEGWDSSSSENEGPDNSKLDSSKEYLVIDSISGSDKGTKSNDISDCVSVKSSASIKSVGQRSEMDLKSVLITVKNDKASASSPEQTWHKIEPGSVLSERLDSNSTQEDFKYLSKSLNYNERGLNNKENSKLVLRNAPQKQHAGFETMQIQDSTNSSLSYRKNFGHSDSFKISDRQRSRSGTGATYTRDGSTWISDHQRAIENEFNLQTRTRESSRSTEKSESVSNGRSNSSERGYSRSPSSRSSISVSSRRIGRSFSLGSRSSSSESRQGSVASRSGRRHKPLATRYRFENKSESIDSRSQLHSARRRLGSSGFKHRSRSKTSRRSSSSLSRGSSRSHSRGRSSSFASRDSSRSRFRSRSRSQASRVRSRSRSSRSRSRSHGRGRSDSLGSRSRPSPTYRKGSRYDQYRSRSRDSSSLSSASTVSGQGGRKHGYRRKDLQKCRSRERARLISDRFKWNAKDKRRLGRVRKQSVEASSRNLHRMSTHYKPWLGRDENHVDELNSRKRSDSFGSIAETHTHQAYPSTISDLRKKLDGYERYTKYRGVNEKEHHLGSDRQEFSTNCAEAKVGPLTCRMACTDKVQRQTRSVDRREKVVIFHSSALAYEMLGDVCELVKSLAQYSTSTCHWKALVHSRMICDLDEFRSASSDCQKLLELLSQHRGEGHVELLPFHGCDEDKVTSAQCADQMLRERKDVQMAFVIGGSTFEIRVKTAPNVPTVCTENAVQQLNILQMGEKGKSLMYMCIGEQKGGFKFSVIVDGTRYTGSGKTKKEAKQAAAKAALIGRYKILTVPMTERWISSDPRIVKCSIKDFLDLHLSSKNV